MQSSHKNVPFTLANRRRGSTLTQLGQCLLHKLVRQSSSAWPRGSETGHLRPPEEHRFCSHLEASQVRRTPSLLIKHNGHSQVKASSYKVSKNPLKRPFAGLKYFEKKQRLAVSRTIQRNREETKYSKTGLESRVSGRSSRANFSSFWMAESISKGLPQLVWGLLLKVFLAERKRNRVKGDAGVGETMSVFKDPFLGSSIVSCFSPKTLFWANISGLTGFVGDNGRGNLNTLRNKDEMMRASKKVLASYFGHV